MEYSMCLGTKLAYLSILLFLLHPFPGTLCNSLTHKVVCVKDTQYVYRSSDSEYKAKYECRRELGGTRNVIDYSPHWVRIDSLTPVYAFGEWSRIGHITETSTVSMVRLNRFNLTRLDLLMTKGGGVRDMWTLDVVERIGHLYNAYASMSVKLGPRNDLLFMQRDGNVLLRLRATVRVRPGSFTPDRSCIHYLLDWAQKSVPFEIAMAVFVLSAEDDLNPDESESDPSSEQNQDQLIVSSVPSLPSLPEPSDSSTKRRSKGNQSKSATVGKGKGSQKGPIWLPPVASASDSDAGMSASGALTRLLSRISLCEPEENRNSMRRKSNRLGDMIKTREAECSTSTLVAQRGRSFG